MRQKGNKQKATQTTLKKQSKHTKQRRTPQSRRYPGVPGETTTPLILSHVLLPEKATLCKTYQQAM